MQNEVDFQKQTQDFNHNVLQEQDKIQNQEMVNVNMAQSQGNGDYVTDNAQQGDKQQSKQEETSTSTQSPQLGPNAPNIDEGIHSSQIRLNNEKKSTPAVAYMNLFKGYIGSGVLALPFAFSQAGWVLSTIIFLIISLIIFQTMKLLFELADSFNKDGIDYSYLARHHFGRKGQLAVSSFLIVFQVGCCISYVIFFIKFLENVFDMAGQTKGDNDFIYLLIALAIIIPMSLINNINAFAQISMMTNFMAILTLLAIFFVILFIFLIDLEDSSTFL